MAPRIARHELVWGEVAGRSGTLAVQGAALGGSSRMSRHLIGRVPGRCRAAAALFVACAVIWLVSLGFRGLYNPDEGRYAEISREMLASGDWVIPHLNGLVYIEKPPLQYWATAISEAVFGQNDWAARLYTGLCALATVYAIWALIRREWGAAAAARGAIMLGIVAVVRAAGSSADAGHEPDAVHDADLRRLLQCAARRALAAAGCCSCWAGIAGGLHDQGADCRGAAAVHAAASTRRCSGTWAPWRRLLLVRGAALFALLCLPWLILIQHRLPQFFQFFFVREHFQRFLDQDRESLPALVVSSFRYCWRASCRGCCRRCVRCAWTGVPGQRAPGFDLRRFAWVWCVVIFVFFSASDSKLSTYILPMFPVLALLMASAPMPRLNADLRITGIGMLVLGVLLLAGALLLPRILALPSMYDARRAPYFCQHSTGAGADGRCAARPAVSPALAEPRRWHPPDAGDRRWAGLPPGRRRCGPRRWSRRCTPAPRCMRSCPHALRRDVPVYSVRTYDQSLTFYLRHPVTLVEYRGELDFGQTLEPDKSIATLAAFAPVWRDSTQALAVVEQQDLPADAGRRITHGDPREFTQNLHREPAMTWLTWCLLLGGVLLNAAAQLLLKAATRHSGELVGGFGPGVLGGGPAAAGRGAAVGRPGLLRDQRDSCGWARCRACR